MLERILTWIGCSVSLRRVIMVLLVTGFSLLTRRISMTMVSWVTSFPMMSRSVRTCMVSRPMNILSTVMLRSLPKSFKTPLKLISPSVWMSLYIIRIYIRFSRQSPRLSLSSSSLRVSSMSAQVPSSLTFSHSGMKSRPRKRVWSLVPSPVR